MGYTGIISAFLLKMRKRFWIYFLSIWRKRSSNCRIN